MKHQTTNDIYLYWNRIRGTNAAPERGEIEPTDIRAMLKDTFILEVKDPQDYSFRLAGTRICSLFGQEMKGRNLLSLLSGDSGEAVETILHSTTEDATVSVLGLIGKTPAERSIALEVIFLPLSLRGRTDARVLGTISPLKTPFWMGMQPITSLELASFRLIMPHQHRNEVGRVIKTREERLDEEIHAVSTVGDLLDESAPAGARRVGHLFVYDGGVS